LGVSLLEWRTVAAKVVTERILMDFQGLPGWKKLESSILAVFNPRSSLFSTFQATINDETTILSCYDGGSRCPCMPDAIAISRCG
jgi:hypothetical protein